MSAITFALGILFVQNGNTLRFGYSSTSGCALSKYELSKMSRNIYGLGATFLDLVLIRNPLSISVKSENFNFGNVNSLDFEEVLVGLEAQPAIVDGSSSWIIDDY